jgi:hypothetical protein
VIFGKRPPSLTPPITLDYLTAKHRADDGESETPVDYVGRHRGEPASATLKYGGR